MLFGHFSFRQGFFKLVEALEEMIGLENNFAQELKGINKRKA